MRKFYDLRDEEVNLEEGQKPTLRPIARKRAAAAALLALINSAADNIHGGLYDEESGSVVQVDGLLALLGEAMLFVDRKLPILPKACLLLTKTAIRTKAQPISHSMFCPSQSNRGLTNGNAAHLCTMRRVLSLNPCGWEWISTSTFSPGFTQENRQQYDVQHWILAHR